MNWQKLYNPAALWLLRSPVHRLADNVTQADCQHKKADFTRNRTCPMTKINPFHLPETHTKAMGNDVRDLPRAEKKGGEIRPVSTISRDVMRVSSGGRLSHRLSS